ncbi:hypothetical protein BDV95DRAFT_590808 [Massariosphaeria phaeospora]|uniref:Uncharacterized protein n=1 Tax=Massariosphaeria phaeospora TaxID=100035 RepID=A0A7C8IDP9_9PLEO|nr:hypothetical protein BDV95DRAFT_590808 [Massariosphaeria phaeospora]
MRDGGSGGGGGGHEEGEKERRGVVRARFSGRRDGGAPGQAVQGLRLPVLCAVCCAPSQARCCSGQSCVRGRAGDSLQGVGSKQRLADSARRVVVEARDCVEQWWWRAPAGSGSGSGFGSGSRAGVGSKACLTLQARIDPFDPPSYKTPPNTSCGFCFGLLPLPGPGHDTTTPRLAHDCTPPASLGLSCAVRSPSTRPSPVLTGPTLGLGAKRCRAASETMREQPLGSEPPSTANLVCRGTRPPASPLLNVARPFTRPHTIAPSSAIKPTSWRLTSEVSPSMHVDDHNRTLQETTLSGVRLPPARTTMSNTVSGQGSQERILWDTIGDFLADVI